MRQAPQTRIAEKHPHARGEDALSRCKACRTAETPPRTWGRLAHERSRCAYERNTPTHVGKTAWHRCRSGAGRKHPHARGEDPAENPPSLCEEETPPRTWGRPRGLPGPRARHGNTPTHVGKTQGHHTFRTQAQKHPHARGEDLFEVHGRAPGWETPPRTWGRRPVNRGGDHLRGNTPTHVGKTSSQSAVPVLI